jgi:predicted transcriptional regulator
MVTREITIKESKGAFSLFKKSVNKKDEYDFSGIASLRQLLSNEKARILDVIKTDKPASLYELAKKLGRSFKSIHDDVKLLERFGFIEIVENKVNKRIRHQPKIVADIITIHIKI